MIKNQEVTQVGIQGGARYGNREMPAEADNIAKINIIFTFSHIFTTNVNLSN